MIETTRPTATLFALLLGLGLAGCGESEKQEAANVQEAETADTMTADGEEDYATAQTRFYEDYGAAPDVRRTEGGVFYKVLTEGSGASPALGDYVTVHYEGRLSDGTIFDSSYARGAPANFPSDRLIVGWQQVLPIMHVGDKWEIVIPARLGYGARGAGTGIPPHATLIFTLELLGIGGA